MAGIPYKLMILLWNITYLYLQNIYLTQYTASTPYPVRFSSLVWPKLELNHPSRVNMCSTLNTTYLYLNTTYLYLQNIYLTQCTAPTPYSVRFSSSVWPTELELNHNWSETWRHPPRVNMCLKYRFGTWVRYINFVFGRHLKYNCNSENFKTSSSKCPTRITKLYTGDVNVLYDLYLILLGPLRSRTTQRFGSSPGKGSRSTSNTSGIFIYTYISISPFRDTVEMLIASSSGSLIAAIAIMVCIAAIHVVWRRQRTPTNNMVCGEAECYPEYYIDYKTNIQKSFLFAALMY